MTENNNNYSDLSPELRHTAQQYDDAAKLFEYMHDLTNGNNGENFARILKKYANDPSFFEKSYAVDKVNHRTPLEQALATNKLGVLKLMLATDAVQNTLSKNPEGKYFVSGGNPSLIRQAHDDPNKLHVLINGRVPISNSDRVELAANFTLVDGPENKPAYSDGKRMVFNAAPKADEIPRQPVPLHKTIGIVPGIRMQVKPLPDDSVASLKILNSGMPADIKLNRADYAETIHKQAFPDASGKQPGKRIAFHDVAPKSPERHNNGNAFGKVLSSAKHFFTFEIFKPHHNHPNQPAAPVAPAQEKFTAEQLAIIKPALKHFVKSDPHHGKDPLTQKQFEHLAKQNASLFKKANISLRTDGIDSGYVPVSASELLRLANQNPEAHMATSSSGRKQ